MNEAETRAEPIDPALKATGRGVVDGKLRNIVLMRPVASMIEFKPIIGRGNRL